MRSPTVTCSSSASPWPMKMASPSSSRRKRPAATFSAWMLSGRLHAWLYRGDEHGERSLRAADDAAGMDAFGGGHDPGLGAHVCTTASASASGIEGIAVGLGPKAGGMNLNVAAVEPHRVAEDRLVRAADQAVEKEQQHQAEHDGHQRDGGAPPVAPHVAPRHFEHFRHRAPPLFNQCVYSNHARISPAAPTAATLALRPKRARWRRS